MGNANGSKFLKVTGILMIIFGAISIIASIIALLGIAALNVMSDAVGVTHVVAYNIGMLYFAGFLSLASSVIELIAGIIGVINAEKPEKAQTCMVWGVIVAVMCVLGCIFTAVGGQSFPFFNLVTGLAVPVLYIIGAVKNKG
ncbi:MAG: hypothetical protein ACI4M3_06775 [Acutalibacteraceae bacterium]